MNQEPKKRNSKPVVTYILILFTAAFFLMAFSLLATQRSNDQTLDELRQSISSLEEGQTAQNHALTLQDELDLLQQEVMDLGIQLDESQAESQALLDTSEQLHAELDAVTVLFSLEEYYRLGDTDSCASAIVYIQDTGADQILYGMDDAQFGNRYDELLDIITVDWDEIWETQP